MRICDACFGEIANLTGDCPQCGRRADPLAHLMFPSYNPVTKRRAPFRFVSRIENAADGDFDFEIPGPSSGALVVQPEALWPDEDLARIAQSAGNQAAIRTEVADNFGYLIAAPERELRAFGEFPAVSSEHAVIPDAEPRRQWLRVSDIIQNLPHVRWPDISLSNLPEINFPRMPKIPRLEMPRLPEVNFIWLKNVWPQLGLPHVHQLGLPHVQWPGALLQWPRALNITLPALPHLSWPTGLGAELLSCVTTILSRISMLLRETGSKALLFTRAAPRRKRQGPFITDKLPHLAYEMRRLSAQRQAFWRRISDRVKYIFRPRLQFSAPFTFADVVTAGTRFDPRPALHDALAATSERASIVTASITRQRVGWAAALILVAAGGFFLTSEPNLTYLQQISAQEKVAQKPVARPPVETPRATKPVQVAALTSTWLVDGVPLPLARIDHLPAAPENRVARSRRRLAVRNTDEVPAFGPNFRSEALQDVEAHHKFTRPMLPAAEMRERGPNSPDAIANAQVRLNRLGYPVGSELGRYNSKTRQAIIAFQRAEGVPETGRIDSALMIQLEAAVKK